MNLSLLLICASLLVAIVVATDTFQPIQRITNFPIRDTSYMGPFRNTLEEKVQTLMKQRRKVAPTSSNEPSNANTKSKTIVPRSVVTDLSAKRRVNSEQASEEAYNELFLDLNQMSVKPKKKLNHLALKVPSSSILKPLSGKKPQTNELAGKSQSEYFQSDSFKKNKSRQNNPLRLKRLQLLHDQSFLEKHQKLGNFIFSKNKDNLDLIAQATTTVATTTSLNQIQNNKHSSKKNKKLNEANIEEKSTTFQNRLPNLRDSSSENQNNDIIFNAKEKLEDLNKNNTKDVEEKDDEIKSKSEFETQSTLLNDENTNGVRKASSKKINFENEKSNTLSMQRHFNPNQQQSHHHHHNSHHHQNQVHNRQLNNNEFFRPLSLKKAPTTLDHPLRPNNYFQAKERLLSHQGPNSEYYKPSNYYQHNKVPNFNEVERINQPQGPLPSGFHFKLLKSKRPQSVVAANTEEANLIEAESDKTESEPKKEDSIIPDNVSEDKLVEKVDEIVIKEAEVNPIKESIVDEITPQKKETTPLSEEVMVNKEIEPNLTDIKSEIQKEELTNNKDDEFVESTKNELETLKE